MRKSIVGIMACAAIALGLVACNSATSTNNNTDTTAVITSKDFAGTWKGNFIMQETTTGTSKLALDSVLKGSYRLIVPSSSKGGLTFLNITASAPAGTISFSLPLDSEDVGQSACISHPPVWACSGTLSNNKLTLKLFCSGTACQSDSVSWNDSLTKQ